MSVCLVIPPSGFLLDDRVFMSLGILKVAAVLERSGIEVHVLDLSGISDYSQAVERHQCSAAVVGITATTSQMPAVVEIVRVLRQINPSARIILGGAHATLTHATKHRARSGRAFAQVLDLVDTVVVGDGEDAIFEALSPIAPRVVDANDPKGKLFLTNGRLEVLPHPARHLLDVDSYHYEIEGHRALSLIAQLGCPFACTFCGGRNSPSLRRIRTRPTEAIILELAELYAHFGMTGFMFHDDELNVNPGVVGLMRGIRQLQDDVGEEFRLRGFAKAELLTKEQAETMYEAGFRWLLIGFESAHPRILENIQKKATVEQNTRAMEIARRAGIKVKALMSIGHAGENEETVRATKDWLLREAPDDFDVTIITPYPGAPYHDAADETDPGVWTYTVKNGDRLHMHETDYLKVSDYYKGVPGSYRSHVWTDCLKQEEIVLLRDEVEETVRKRLGIAYPRAWHEHSMGQQ